MEGGSLMGEMVRYGVLPNPYTPGVLVDFYGHPISSGGGGYASLTGAGQTVTPGDLAQAGGFSVVAPVGDTVGISLVDNSGVAGVLLEAANGGGMQINNSGGGGMIVNSDGGIIVNETGGGGIDFSTGGGITLAGNAGGVGLIASSSGTIQLTAAAAIIINGSSEFQIVAPGGTRFAQITTPSNPPANFDKLYFKSDDNLYALNHAGVEHLIGGASVDTGWIDATSLLVNSWSTAGGYARYRRLNGVVYVQLAVNSGVATTVLTLPAGFRINESSVDFPIVNTNSGIVGSGFSNVSSAGVVQAENNAGTVPNSTVMAFSYPADA